MSKLFTPPFSTAKAHRYGLILLLVVINVLVYWRVTSFGFVNFDDPEYISRNPFVQQGLTRESIRWAFTTVNAGYWIPLTWLSYMADVELFGLTPAGPHFTNVLLHIANTLLLFFWLRRWTRADTRAFLVAALFAVHPLHVESVAWITERKDVLSTLFLWLAFIGYRSWTVERRRSGFALLYGGFVCSLMAKGTGVTLPVLLLLLDYWPLQRLQQPLRRHVRPLLVEKIPLFAISFVFSGITFWAQRLGGAVGTWEQYHSAVRLANAAQSYVRYLLMCIWPSGLSPFYPHPGSRISYTLALAAALLLVVITWAVLRARARAPYAAVGWLFYLISLLPMIGLVQVGGQALADRFTYVPLVGIFIAFVWGTGDAFAASRLLSQCPRFRYLALALWSLILGALMIVAHRQTLFWKDTLTLFSRALAVTKNNAYAHYNLGAEYFSKGDLETAAFHFTEAARLNRRDYEALFNLGNIRRLQGRLQEALDAYMRAKQQNPSMAAILNNIGVTLTMMSRDVEAQQWFERALEVDPQLPDARVNLAQLTLRKGDPAAAEAQFRELAHRYPTNAAIRFGWACAAASLGQIQTAREQFEETVNLAPHHHDALREWANLELLQGNPSNAVALLRRALHVAPNDAVAMNNLAYILGTRSDSSPEELQEALDLAERACALTSNSVPSFVNTLKRVRAAASRE